MLGKFAEKIDFTTLIKGVDDQKKCCDPLLTL